MEICPICKRNWNKTIHNLSEIFAGIGVLVILFPSFYLLWIEDKNLLLVSVIGTIILFISCIIHLYVEMRVTKYRRKNNG